MMLSKYWPQQQQVNDCIKNEAETAHVAVLLAAHLPSALTTIDVETNISAEVSEDDLLAALLTDNVPSGALILPITGASGAGKTHLIRWLDAQLQRSPKRDQLHIIRIPKSASLKTVVELILEPLKDNDLYKGATEDLKRAMAEVNVENAAIIFRAHLENALSDIRKRLESEAQQYPERGPSLRQEIGHARDLPKLFADSALSQHFVDHVLSRVVSRALRGRAETTELGSSETEHEQVDENQFTAEDLTLPDTVNLSDAGLPIRNYYKTIVHSSDRSRLDVAIKLLNEAIDPAIGNLFQLQQATGGITFQDIILAVRKTLFEEGKDLVLLVEDFAALSGIQDVLLNVCIYEGVNDKNEKVRATMRTAIALTEGTLTFFKTIHTRAQRQWLVGSNALSPDEIREFSVEMVGAYLNAARWGEEELKRKFEFSGGETSGIWLDTWRGEDDDATQATVRAFGFSNAGHPLFPFNRRAINALVDVHLLKNGQLVLNPRKVINSILRNILLLRSQYEANAFPSSPPADDNSSRSLRPNSWLATWITRVGRSDANRKRLGPLLAIWGGNPTSEAGIANVPPEIFKGFGLPSPAELDSIGFSPENPVEISTPAKLSLPKALVPVKTDPVSTASDPWFIEWQSKLDRWAAGTELAQVEANEIRKGLAEIVQDTIDWPSLRLRSQTIRPGSIHIANARGNAVARRVIQVCTSFEDEDGRIRAGMLGALRYGRNQKRWAYAGSDDDYVATNHLVDALISQLIPKLLEDADRQINVIARGLITQARVAGLVAPVRLNNIPAVLSATFEPLPLMEPQSFDEAWERVRTSIWSDVGNVPARKVLQRDLQDLIGTFQGNDGRNLYGLDGVRLIDALAESANSNDAEAALPDDLAPETKTYLTPLSTKRLWGPLQGIIGKLRNFRAELSDYLDAEFDKGAFISNLEHLASSLSATGNWPRHHISMQDFERRLIDFRATPIMDLVNKAALLDDASSDQLPKVLNALGTLNLSSVERGLSFLKLVDTIISEAEQNVDRVYSNYQQANPTKLADEIDALLSVLADDIVSSTTQGEFQ